MPAIFAALAFLLLIVLVLARVAWLRRLDVDAMAFGKTHPSDFILPPFVLFYLYLVLAHAFRLPTLAHSTLFQSTLVAWVGVGFCCLAFALMLWAVLSFGRSFRVGIDADHPGGLVTSGAFAISRNPIYVAFAFMLAGQFLVFPHWLLLVYLLSGFWLLNRQVLREEAYLRGQYGDEYTAYCYKVRRYL